MKEYLKKVPHFLWYFIVMLAVVLVMDIRNTPQPETQHIFIEDLQKASVENHRADGYNVEYYGTKERFITALEKDADSRQHCDYIIEKIQDPAKNRRYAKLTLYYDVSTYYTIRHNIWLTVRTIDGKPASVFELLLTRMDLGNLFALHSVDGRTYTVNATNGKITNFTELTVYPGAPQKISGVDNVYYTSMLSDENKARDNMLYNKYYIWNHNIFFMEM